VFKNSTAFLPHWALFHPVNPVYSMKAAIIIITFLSIIFFIYPEKLASMPRSLHVYVNMA
jgi:hypothetical protein